MLLNYVLRRGKQTCSNTFYDSVVLVLSYYFLRCFVLAENDSESTEAAAFSQLKGVAHCKGYYNSRNKHLPRSKV